MPRPIVCIAPGGRLPREAAAGLAPAVAGSRLIIHSLSGYLAAPQPSARILLCPAGASLASDLVFLRRAARRLLWPPPFADFRDAIAGLRTTAAGSSAGARKTARPAGPRPVPRPPPSRGAGAVGDDTAAAILLEGRVDPRRIRAVLASGAPRDWIVESPRHVVLPDALSQSVERAGVRWWALEPVEVVALYAVEALAAARARWSRLLPPRTPVWIRPERAKAPRPARPRRSSAGARRSRPGRRAR